jgi:hypothetical protein
MCIQRSGRLRVRGDTADLAVSAILLVGVTAIMCAPSLTNEPS